MSTEFTPNFFDEASKAWRGNKKKKGESFVYLCQHKNKSGKLCKNSSFTHHLNFDLFCKWHFLDSQKRHDTKFVY